MWGKAKIPNDQGAAGDCTRREEVSKFHGRDKDMSVYEHDSNVEQMNAT